MSAQRNTRVGLDWASISIFFAIVFVGWLMLYTISYQGEGSFWFDFHSIVGRQTVWIGVGLIIFIAVYSLDWRIWNSLAYPIYGLTLLSLIAVLLFGKEVKGASSWFVIMGYSFQPSEFAKLGTTLGVSAFLGQANLNINNLSKILIVTVLFLVPAFLIFLQPDAGTAIIFLAFLIPLFRAGLNPIIYVLASSIAFVFIGSLMSTPFLILLIILLIMYLVLAYTSKQNRLPLSLWLLLTLFTLASYNYLDYRIIFLVVIAASGYFLYLTFREAKYRQIIISVVSTLFFIVLSFGTQWMFDNVLKPHQQARLNVWLKPDLSDPRGALYNIIQSKTAIGSGGFTGKGFLDGTMTKLNYVPEQSTDFIFSVLGEEQGFIGAASLIILMLVLIIRLTMIGERATLPFVRYYAYSLAGILFFHYFINIGMTMGIMPVIGIPLPLMSKGGSSLVTFFIMMAILLKMDQAGRRV